MILLTGGSGFLGKAVQGCLTRSGLEFNAPLRSDVDWETGFVKNPRKMDLTQGVNDGIIHLAGLCGGIQDNIKNPARFLTDNIKIGLNALSVAYNYSIPKFLNISSACAYPDNGQTKPFLEWQIWNGRPQETHAPYGIAKRTVMEMVRAYEKQYGLCGYSVVLANLYGPGVKFDKERTHVIPALTQKMVEAMSRKALSIKCFGSGEARREFLFVEDAARAIVHIYKNYDLSKDLRVPEARGIINVGSGHVKSIKEVAETIKELVGYEGVLEWDTSYPDGNAVREINSDFIRGSGWEPQTPFRDGVKQVVDDFLKQMVLS